MLIFDIKENKRITDS